MQYLKDTFIVQGILTSSNRFLIATEATLYIYESEQQYFKAQNPEEILNLLQYQIRNHGNSIMLLTDQKNTEKIFAFYSPSQDQIKIWCNTLNESKEKYDQFQKDVIIDQKWKVIPFDEMKLTCSLDQIILKTD